MPVSVRMDPMLEKELDAAARRQGVSRSRFIVDAVERALGKKNPYELMLKLKAEEEAEWKRLGRPMPDDEAYETDKARATLLKKLRSKHGVDDAG